MRWLVIALLLASPTIAQPDDLPECTDEQIEAALAALPDYGVSDMTGFVSIRDGRLVVNDSDYEVRGVNYYPSQYPWRRFLTETDPSTLADELELLQSVDFNTLRIFLWNEALFQCPGSGAIPNPDNFARLDAIIHAAAVHDFRLIVTLNDLPDLIDYPLYTDPEHTAAQTEFIIMRYRDEPAILAWDARNEGDIDYGTVLNVGGGFSRAEVLRWLAIETERVRSLDSNHLVTAGWYQDAESTIPFVDFVSFHHWSDSADLLARITAIRSQTDLPALLQEFGYSTQRMWPEDQAKTIAEIIATADEQGLVGWLIWTAFDFPTDRTCVPPDCPSPDNAEHYFGLWTTDYTPKPVIDVFAN